MHPILHFLHTPIARTISYYFMEGPASTLEIGSFLLLPFVQKTFPRGNGEPVILIPGFSEGDMHMQLLEKALLLHGYHATTWGFGTNTGNHDASIRRLIGRVRHTYAATGKPVHLIGHSLGGLYALYLAHAMPTRVASVVTMGSPMNLNVYQVNPVFATFIRKVTGKTLAEHVTHPRFGIIHTPPHVPTTTIAAYNDTIVGTSSCMFSAEYRKSPLLDTVVTHGTHCGHVIALATYMVILHHLTHVRHPQPYNPHEYFSPHLVSCLYPSQSSF